MHSDEYGDESWWYSITSLYYDSPDYRCYREKVEWLKYRRKLRIRYYESNKQLQPEDIVFVEIKQRFDRVTQKRRVPMTRANACILCNERKVPDHAPEDATVIQEILTFIYEYDLQPTCTTSYFRQARVGDDRDPGLRITYDTNIRERHRDLDLASKQIGQVMIPLNQAIMEIKINEHMPLWITELITKYDLTLVRVSKYCKALETAQLVDNRIYAVV